LTIFAGAVLRPVGGAVADKLGGIKSLYFFFGAVFQLVPQRFGKDIGIMTGIIGASGGLGGTALIKTLGWSKGAFDGYSAGFMIFAGVVLIAIAGISLVKTRWRTTWGVQAGGRI